MQISVEVWEKILHLSLMKIAYGYKCPAGSFDHVAPDRVYVDRPDTLREHRRRLFETAGLRNGDTLFLFRWGDLARGGEIPIFQDKLGQMGVTVEIVQKPEQEKRSRGRPPGSVLDRLYPQDDAALRGMWGNPVIYTQRYCRQWAEERVGETVTRQMMIHRYGNRWKK